MWHRKILNNLNNWFSLRESKDPTSITYIRGRFECLDPAFFKKIHIAKACVTKLDVSLSSIQGYVRTMQQLNHLDFRVSQIDVRSIGLAKQTVTVEKFFQDPLGRYLDSHGEVQRFRQEALSLLSRYLDIEQETLGIPGYNARFVRALLISVAELADHLRTYSMRPSP